MINKLFYTLNLLALYENCTNYLNISLTFLSIITNQEVFNTISCPEYCLPYVCAYQSDSFHLLRMTEL